ncbi:hypothetical protein [Sediminibacillus halophilus]|uniref:Uncharacterized protein n=1 Tax=Sediminibacillus halophilus TaxID=482461 RepID=A0A1G9T3U8_9BACI|nr:hypothetical protein [Sediminibacillus halophilus]SDM42287.1 hypothetical protein SAMN05216244_2423 [Sediminibacillus halophilus]
MFFESIVLPFIVGLVTNKVSESFQQKDLALVVDEIYNKSVDEFNKKYQNAYGGAYDNFLARQKNLELVMKTVLSFKDTSEIEFENILDYSGNPTPEEVVKDFIIIFNENLNNDERLIQYRHMREHHFLTERIMDDIKQIKQIRFKKFVSPEEFFDFEANGNITEAKKLDSDVKRVIDNLKVSDIVLIDSFRGFGKTETLKNVSISKGIGDLFDSIIVMRHGVRNIVDSLQSEFFQEKKYLIIVDDSELCTGEIKELLNFMKSVGVFSKLLLSVQTYSNEKIKSLIIKAGLFNSMVQVSLNNWEREDYIDLLRVAAQVPEYMDEDIIVAKYPSPTLIKWIGEKKLSSDKNKIEVLFREHKELLENDTYGILNNYISREDCNRLLFSLCCAVPFDLSDEQCNLINKSIQRNYDIKMIVRLMQKGGIIRKVGYKYRFYPDIKGDIFLAYSLNDLYDVNILDYWIRHDQNRVLENINEAGLVSKMDIQDILKSLIDEWSLSEAYYEQCKNLEIASYIVRFSPESVTNLIYCYLDSVKNANGGDYFRLTTDDFGPVLLKLWRYNNDIETILNFLCELENIQIDGTYDNYKVKGITRDLFSPVTNSPRKIIESLTILQKWISNDKNAALTIFKYAASEILKGGHEVTKPIINGIQFGVSVVQVSDEVVRMREKCIEIIEYLVNSRLENNIVKIIESICHEIGAMSFGKSEPEEKSLKEVIEQERKKLVELLGNKLLESKDISVNIIIERILIYWWAGQYSGCEFAESYLLQFKRDGKYLFAKYYVDVDYRVFSFEEIAKLAPSKERWDWFVDEVMQNTNDRRDDSRRIAEVLHSEIKSVKALNNFLIYESEIISNFELAWSSPNIIERWFEYNNNLFIEFIKSMHYSGVAGFLKASIFNSVITHSNQKEEMISSFLVPEANLTNDEIFILLNIAQDNSLSNEYVVTMINSIIDIYNFEYAGGIIHRLYFIFKNRERSYLINILLKIIQKYPFNDSMADMIDLIIQQYINDLKIVKGFQEFKDEILVRISAMEKLNYHKEKIIEVLLRSKEEAIEFIEDRLRNTDINGIDKVPYGGFSFLTKFISDVESFSFLVNRLINFVDKRLLAEYDLRTIIKPLFLRADGEGEPVGPSVLKYFINEDNARGVLKLMECFTLSEKTVVDFVNGLKYLNENGKGKEAEGIIYSQRFPDGGWSRSIGQNSPELMNRISLYSEVHKLIPFGRLKLVVESCIDFLKKDMDKDLIGDEEILNPR